MIVTSRSEGFERIEAICRSLGFLLLRKEKRSCEEREKRLVSLAEKKAEHVKQTTKATIDTINKALNAWPLIQSEHGDSPLARVQDFSLIPSQPKPDHDHFQAALLKGAAFVKVIHAFFLKN